MKTIFENLTNDLKEQYNFIKKFNGCCDHFLIFWRNKFFLIITQVFLRFYFFLNIYRFLENNFQKKIP